MAAIIDLKHRIKGVKSTQKITRAMKMVAAAKLRRAQSDVLSARPYAHRMLALLNSLASRVPSEDHPLLRFSNDENIELVIITADKGLCGSFNTNIIKQNIVFALGLKLIFIILALLGLATLWMAIAADMGASLLFIANGMRLLSAQRYAQVPENT